MNVVADRRAVRCRVIRAEDLKRGPLPERGFEDERNQVGFRIVRLADLAVRIRAGRSEVTECRPFQAVGLTIPGKGAPDGELGLAIGVDWTLRVVFRDGRGLTRKRGVEGKSVSG